MTKKIVLFDMDGVGWQYDKKLLRLAHERFGLPLYTPGDVTDFCTEILFPEEYRAKVDELSNETGFFRDLEPFPGAVAAMQEALDHPDLEPFICTAPKRFTKNPHCTREKLESVVEHLGHKWADRVIPTRNKTLVHGHVLIDDKPKVSGVHKPSWEHVYYDRPYNKVKDRHRITDWSTWKEVVFPILFP